MAHRISGIVPGSPAFRAGLRAGDELIRINGEVVKDAIDYQHLCARRRLTVSVRRGDFTLTKEEYADPGLVFEGDLNGGTRMCLNRCLFCFVDQLPENARESLRVKDDDWRLSLLTGSYVTLTNVPDAELDRIIRRHASPLYISVHASDPELRARILGTDRAKRIGDQLERLARGGIRFHTQAVLCPGINDGPWLERTVADLSALWPACRSLALVPVGLTGHREGLCPLKPYTREQARAVIGIAERAQKELSGRIGTRFVFPSDEFYLLAGLDLPPEEAYEGFDQIDDGVGMLRLLETEFREALEDAELPSPGKERKILIACGRSAEGFLRGMLEGCPVPGVRVRVQGIDNDYFGRTVTVSGLITGRDLTAQADVRDAEKVLITECMLRPEDSIFLDGMTLGEAQERLGVPLIPVGRTGAHLLRALISEE